ncbi:MAG: MBL fold metallo-hydrolase [Candidatus Caldarchaeum sp.]|nr:MBL fold metallo-hydrolase [Candidatus Caldarchaeum sp.]
MSRLVVLGAGSIVPTRNRFASGLYLETARAKILFDPGPSTLHRLAKIDVMPQSLDAVLVTHFHLDHVSDLPPLIMLWPYNADGTPSKQPKILRLIGPKGLNELVQKITNAFPYLISTMNADRYLMVEEVEGGEKKMVNECVVTAFDVEHYSGVGYRVDFSGRSIVYSGDAVPDERLVKVAKGCDVLVHECSFPHDRLVGKHTSEKQLAEIAARVKPRKLIVTHLYPVWLGRESEMLEALKEANVAEVVIAEDMTAIEI